MNPQAGPPSAEPRNPDWLVWVGLAALVLLGGALASKGSPLLVLALLGGLIAVGTFLRPDLGAFVCLVAICTDEVGYFVIRIAGYPLTTPKLAVAMLIVCWTLHALVYRKPLLSTTPVTTGLVAVVVSMLVTMMVSGNFSWGLLDTQSVFILAIFVHYAYVSIRPERMWTFTLYATGFILLLLTYTVYDGRTAERMGAGYGDPNGWGSAVILMCHLASGALLAHRSRWSTSLLIVLLGLYVTSIFQTASRSTFLAAVAIVPLGLWGMASKPRVPLLAGILALVLVPSLVSDPEYLYQRLESAFSGEASTSRTEGGIMGRIFLAQYALETFSDNPIFGGGPGYIQGTTAEYFHTKGSRDAHNSYLQLLAEQGLVGMVSHGYLAFLLVREWLVAYRTTRSSRVRIVLYQLMVGLIGYAIMMLSLGRLMDAAIGYMVLVFVLGWCRVAQHPELLPPWMRGPEPDADPSTPDLTPPLYPVRAK